MSDKELSQQIALNVLIKSEGPKQILDLFNSLETPAPQPTTRQETER